MDDIEDWYALALADGTPLIAWDPQVGLGDGGLRVAITLDDDSARCADAVWQVLDVPEATDGHIDVRVVLDVRPEVVALLDGAHLEENAAARIAHGSFVDDDVFAALHRVESFVPVEWRIDEVVDL